MEEPDWVEDMKAKAEKLATLAGPPIAQGAEDTGDTPDGEDDAE